MATALFTSPSGLIGRLESERPYYRPELDLLRLAAFLAVYLCHSIPNAAVDAAWKAPSHSWLWLLAAIKDAGNFGVCLFFMLSAFLITELLRREIHKYGQVDAPAFYLRRILRIWPLYFAVTGAYVLAGQRFHAMRIEPGRAWSYFLLAGNWYIALHPWIQTPLRSLWSISVEEQFYLAWPLLARFGGLRRLMQVSLTLIPISLVVIAVGSQDETFAYNTVWLNSLTQFQFFAWGALLAGALSGRVPAMPITLRITAAAGGVLTWLAAAYATGIKRPGVQASSLRFCCGYLLVAAGCLLLFLAVFGMRDRWIPRPAVYLGKISFGLYVFHETGFLLIDQAQKHLAGLVPADALWANQHAMRTLLLNKSLALILTIGLAAFSYRFWERPFLRLKEHVTRIKSRAV